MSDFEPVHRMHVVRNAVPAEVYAVVVDFENYPRIFRELTAVRVLERQGARVRAEFRVQVILPARYVVDMACDAERFTVDWTFVEGEVVTANTGAWRLSASGFDTLVEYTVALSVKAPVPAFVLKKVTDTLVSASLPGMFRALEREVDQRRRRGPET
jgi:ribosome-associated toxin RatA of RatAB toxin-antitoxin module